MGRSSSLYIRAHTRMETRLWMHGHNDGNSAEELNGYDDGNGWRLFGGDFGPGRASAEDWPAAAALEREALERAKTSVSSADDTPAFQRWLQALLRPSLTADEREEIIWAMYDYFEPSDSP